MSGVRDTSNEAFNKPCRRQYEAQILEALRAEHGTRLDLSKRLGVPINCITSPVLSLVKAGAIEEYDKVMQIETGTKAWKLRIKEVK